MSDQPTDDRPPMAIAYEWVGRIFAVCIEMIAPGLVGHWLDEKFGIRGLVILGLALGITLAIYHLLQFSKADQRQRNKPDE
ncbi:AtpZ/AtpI family protein [Blastopirellula retiformator]|nr:AtpZ/AtpI family protein [Blastopirellula retiformator]